MDMLDANAIQRMIYLMMHIFISVGMPRNNTANNGAMNNHVTCSENVYTICQCVRMHARTHARAQTHWIEISESDYIVWQK